MEDGSVCDTHATAAGSGHALQKLPRCGEPPAFLTHYMKHTSRTIRDSTLYCACSHGKPDVNEG